MPPENEQEEEQQQQQPPAPAPAPAQVPPGGGDVLGAYLTLVRAQPGLVPDLIGGATLAEIEASVARAKAAYATTRANVIKELGATVPQAHGGAGLGPALTPGYATILAGVGKSKHG